MAIPTNKDALILAINTTYNKLEIVLLSIPPQYTTSIELPGHGKNTLMSICNQVAYLIGWGQLVIQWEKQMRLGIATDFPEKGYNWQMLGELAQKFYTEYENKSYTSLLVKLKETKATILQIIESKTNEALYNTNWYKQYTLGRMIQLNTAAPYKNATVRITKWKKSLNK